MGYGSRKDVKKIIHDKQVRINGIIINKDDYKVDTDNDDILVKAVKKISNLRIFEDEAGKMNLNLQTVGGEILSISQFTLYANTNEGNRPSFVDAMKPDEAKRLYLKFNEMLRQNGFNVYEGIFGAHMDIRLLNDGPVTIEYEFN